MLKSLFYLAKMLKGNFLIQMNDLYQFQSHFTLRGCVKYALASCNIAAGSQNNNWSITPHNFSTVATYIPFQISYYHLIVLVYACLRVLKDNSKSVLQAEVGQTVTMSCLYDLEEDILYSIKWYRDDKEFYRFLPRGLYVYQ